MVYVLQLYFVEIIIEEDGNEKHRSRTACPKDYLSIINTIKDIHHKLEKEFQKKLPIGVCHPGVHSPQTGLKQDMQLVNKKGGGGAVSMDYMMSLPADGQHTLTWTTGHAVSMALGRK